MAKRPTRLRFTEDDLADSHVKKAANRADKAVDKAEKAADKLASKKAKPKLKLETDAAGSRKAKLRFEKAEFTEIERPSVAKHMASRGAAVTLTSKAHQAVSEYEDDNIGVQAVQETTKAIESTAYTVDHAVYSHKLKAYDKAEKLVEKSDQANVNSVPCCWHLRCAWVCFRQRCLPTPMRVQQPLLRKRQKPWKLSLKRTKIRLPRNFPTP